jgi:hypothetical protein
VDTQQLADLRPVQNIAGKSGHSRGDLELLNESHPGEPARSSTIHIGRHNEKAHGISAIVRGRLSEQFEESEQSRPPPRDRRCCQVWHDHDPLDVPVCAFGDLNDCGSGKLPGPDR